MDRSKTVCIGILVGTALTACTNEPQRSVHSMVLDVPFTSQAPFADWGDPYQEACEEASLIMVHYFLEKALLSTEDADKEIRNSTQWIAEQGLPQDINLEQLAWVAEEFYGHNSKIISNPSITSIIAELDAGYPVIVPAAGRNLGNPYFSGEGPWYHMLVVIGYTDDAFITNDPGTRRGKHYSYKKEVLMNAIHDWTGVKEDIESGPKVALVLTTMQQASSTKAIELQRR